MKLKSLLVFHMCCTNQVHLSRSLGDLWCGSFVPHVLVGIVGELLIWHALDKYHSCKLVYANNIIFCQQAHATFHMQQGSI